MNATNHDPEALVRRAETRWADIAAARPDLVPAIAVQRPMVIRTIRVVARLRLEPPAVRLTRQRAADKLEAGEPLIRGEAATLPVALLAPLVLEACDDLAAGGAGDVARRVRGCIDAGRVDVGSLLAASFDRNQHAIRVKALHEGIAPDVLWLAAELAAGPAAHVAARTLLGDGTGDGLAAGREGWRHGYCPACGSWPAFAEAGGGDGRLRCSFCGLDWPARPERCTYCRSVDPGPAWVKASPGAVDRAAACSGCGGYLKWLEPAAPPTPFELLPVEDLASSPVDALAAGRGFGRPPLPDLGGPDRLPCRDSAP